MLYVVWLLTNTHCCYVYIIWTSCRMTESSCRVPSVSSVHASLAPVPTPVSEPVATADLFTLWFTFSRMPWSWNHVLCSLLRLVSVYSMFINIFCDLLAHLFLTLSSILLCWPWLIHVCTFLHLECWRGWWVDSSLRHTLGYMHHDFQAILSYRARLSQNM